jgi:hypothetical protein
MSANLILTQDGSSINTQALIEAFLLLERFRRSFRQQADQIDHDLGVIENLLAKSEENRKALLVSADNLRELAKANDHE